MKPASRVWRRQCKWSGSLRLLSVLFLGHATCSARPVPPGYVDQSLLPAGREEQCVVVVTFPADNVAPLNLKVRQYLLLSHDVEEKRSNAAFKVLKSESWFAVGLAGSNRSSLAKLSRILRLLPHHAIVVERGPRPSEREMSLQNRRLFWKLPNTLRKVLCGIGI